MVDTVRPALEPVPNIATPGGTADVVRGWGREVGTIQLANRRSAIAIIARAG